ncbi:MAG: MBL fold metallo-hydrolase [Christensenellaceae bacterium]|jgi:glyoxylase-like metal-dependent hydrolase (beta-lactamase superfamily II)|nr:MBL fold metallo-hydrolase [Christensenellaceae bacterium]
MYTHKFIVGILSTNCYIVKGDGSNEVVIIDPGGGYDRIKELCTKKEYEVKAILLTHGHFDHVLDLSNWKNDGVPIYIHKLDEKYLDPDKTPSPRFKCPTKVQADYYLNDEQILNFGNIQLKVLHTPGHSPGSVCYINKDDIYSGDTLFYGDYGRYDFSDGNLDDLKKSISKLFTLSDEYAVHPGHGPTTLLKNEKLQNKINEIL